MQLQRELGSCKGQSSRDRWIGGRGDEFLYDSGLKRCRVAFEYFHACNWGEKYRRDHDLQLKDGESERRPPELSPQSAALQNREAAPSAALLHVEETSAVEVREPGKLSLIRRTQDVRTLRS
jgi:hypothetical protein